MIDGADGNDMIDGTAGDDVIDGTAGDDVINTGDGNDTVNAGEGNDVIDGGAGDDVIYGFTGNDVIDGGSGNDMIAGNDGYDILSGGLGDDIIFGGAGNDTLIYEFGHGNDRYQGDNGNDVIVLKDLTTMDGWTIHIRDYPVAIMTLEEYRQNFHEDGNKFSGEIYSPIGEILTFEAIEHIDVEMADEPVPGGDYPLILDDYNQVPNDCRTVVVSGLPAGVVISGAAQPPIFGDDGTYFQVVDVDAYKSGQLDLEFSPGFFGKVDLTVTSYSGEIDNLQTAESSLSFDVEADNDAILFAKSGDVNTIPMGETLALNNTPIEIIVNPRVENAQIMIANIPDGLDILSNGQILTKTNGHVTLTEDQLNGLELNTSLNHSVVNLHIQVTGTDESGNALTAEQEIYFGLTTVSGGIDGAENVTAGFDLKIEACSIERIGNSIVVTELANPSHITNISMTDFNYIRFTDGVFAVSDYSQPLDISSVIARLNADGNQIIVISGLPEDAIIDGAKDLGNGAWGIEPEDVGEDGSVDIEVGTAEEDALVNIKVSVYNMSEEQGTYVGSLATVHGYKSISVDADASFELSENEISAYAGAQAVASAGGSIAMGGVMIEGGVDAKAFVQVELDAAVHADRDSAGFELMVDASAGLTAEGSLKIETDYIPGTSYEASGQVGIKVYVDAGGSGEINCGDGHYGIDGSAGARVGAGVEAGGEIGGEIGGIGADVGATFRAGLIVGAALGGTAMYDDGKITFGIAGEIELFLGVEIEIEITIDTHDIVDTGKLIEEGIITAEEAIVNFGIDAGQLAEQGYHEAAQAVEIALGGVETAMNEVDNVAEDVWSDFVDIWKW